MNTSQLPARLALAIAIGGWLGGALGTAGLAHAQMQDAQAATQPSASSGESTELANGWSAKRMLLGKAVYNEQGLRIGNIEDLIISPDRRGVAYVIVGAGGFIGIGRHDVAVPIGQLEETTGRFVLPHATKESLKAMPAFDYSNDGARREQFIAAADKDVAQGKAAIAELEKKAATETAEAKVKLKEQTDALKEQVKTVETQLNELKNAGVRRWHEFEAAVSAATARLRDMLKSGGT